MWKSSWLPEPLRWVLAALACYRLARLIAQEEGPAAIFVRLRTAAGAYDLGENGEPESSLGRGIACPLCVGLYVAALLLMGVMRPTRVGDWLLGWLGLGGAQALLQQVSD